MKRSAALWLLAAVALPAAALADAVDDLHRRIALEFPLPAPVALPPAAAAPGCRNAAGAKLVEEGNALLRQTPPDLKLACARYAQALSPQGSPGFLPAFFNYGIAAWKMEDYPLARTQFRLAIAAVNKQQRMAGYDEPASRDYPVECANLRSYHFYLNLCALYATDAAFFDGKKLAADIRKQPRSQTCLFPHLTAFAERGEDLAANAHLLWALSNYERLFSYPPHRHHPVLRFNCGLVLLELSDYQGAAVLLDLQRDILADGRPLPPLNDPEYAFRAAAETQAILPPELPPLARGIAAAHVFDADGVARDLSRAVPPDKAASLSAIIGPAAQVLSGPAADLAGHIARLNAQGPALAAWQTDAGRLTAALIGRRLAPSIREIEAAMTRSDWNGALLLVNAAGGGTGHPQVQRLLRPLYWKAKLRGLLSDPRWVAAAVVLAGLLAGAVIALFVVLRNIPQCKRTLACEWTPPAAGPGNTD